MQYLRKLSTYQGLLLQRRCAKRGLRRVADAWLVLMLDDCLLARRERLLPVEGGGEPPPRGQVLRRALAGVVLLDLGQTEAQQVAPFISRQTIERRIGRCQLRS